HALHHFLDRKRNHLMNPFGNKVIQFGLYILSPHCPYWLLLSHFVLPEGQFNHYFFTVQRRHAGSPILFHDYLDSQLITLLHHFFLLQRRKENRLTLFIAGKSINFVDYKFINIKEE